MSERLTQIRTEIDAVDDSIAELLCKRAVLAKAVREVKASDKINPYSPAREKEIIDRVLPPCVKAGFSPRSISQIFLSILSASRSIVGVFEVCFADYRGSSSHRGMINQFGPIDNYKTTASVSDCLDRVVNGLSQFAVVPISKNSCGMVSETLEELMNRPLRVFSSVTVVEDYSLYSAVENIKDIKVVYGFASALSKVTDWSNSAMPGVRFELLGNYASLEKVITEIKAGGNKSVILGTGFTEELGMKALVERVPLTDPESLRYFVVEPSRDAGVRIEENVTIIVCAIKDMVGALSSVLQPFSKRSMTLRKIESRSHQNVSWECVFYLEVEGISHSDEMKDCISELEGKCTFVKVLGGFESK